MQSLHLLQRVSKRRGPPEQPGARRVGEILALPRDPKLKQRRAKRREQHRHQRAEHTEGVVFLVRAEEDESCITLAIADTAPAIIAATEGDEDVPVFYVRELMSQDTPNLLVGQIAQQPLGHRNRGVLVIAACSEGVWLLARHQVKRWLWYPRTSSKLGYGAVDLGRPALAQRLGTRRTERDDGVEVANQVEDHRERDEEPQKGAAEQRTQRDHKPGKGRDQRPGARAGQKCGS